mmetsp:Transcript_14752/g.36103  ORF Transcript_14752/g.36103 Transcript_14752/m.36103 type:complete len:103 (-) Transcript_14752:133-441(-)
MPSSEDDDDDSSDDVNPSRLFGNALTIFLLPFSSSYFASGRTLQTTRTLEEDCDDDDDDGDDAGVFLVAARRVSGMVLLKLSRGRDLAVGLVGILAQCLSWD